VTLTLPDGVDVDVDNRIFSESTNPFFVNEKLNPKGLISQTAESIKLCDDTIRRHMLHNIVIAGGTSMMRGNAVFTCHCCCMSCCIGLGDRLAWELNSRLQQDLKTYINNDLKVTPNSFNRFITIKATQLQLIKTLSILYLQRSRIHLSEKIRTVDWWKHLQLVGHVQGPQDHSARMGRER